jgi:hypothetical protein
VSASDRTGFIRRLATRRFFWEQPAIVNAFVACLSPAEACQSLDVSDPVSWTLRSALLRKLSRDMDTTGVQACHLELVKKLMKWYPDLPRERRSGCGYCLSYLYPYLPELEQGSIVDFFMRSPHVTMRRRGVKILRGRWNPAYGPLVEETWKLFPDSSIALLAVERLDEVFIRDHFNELVEQLNVGGYLARPFLRLKDSLLTDTLASIDEITYCYVRAKEMRPLQRSEALSIFDRNKLDDRVGLLIWSFGQMGLWDVLETITRKANSVLKLKLEESRRRYAELGI